jgi:DNA-binding response OmpR family regulator
MAKIIPTILIVEDDVELSDWMRDYFSNKLFAVTVVYNGYDAIDYIHREKPDIVILDYMLPDIDGVDVCKAVRPTFSNAILMVTAKDEEIDEVLGLEMGADEYLTKPVRARALLTRIKKYLERQKAGAFSGNNLATESKPEKVIHYGNFKVDMQTMTVTLCGEVVETSTKEIELLYYLASRAGEVVYRTQLVKELRGFDYDGFNRSIDLTVSRLRKKLGDTMSNPSRIKTIWGKGYLFVKDAW